MRKRFEIKLFTVNYASPQFPRGWFWAWAWACFALFPFGVLGDDSTNVAAAYHIDVWTTDQGLPQNSITAIAQTREGYLWLGTYNGLVRFDGVRFTVFTSANTTDLKSNRILKLYVDSHDNLWIGTEGGGLTRFKDGQFTTYSADDTLLEGTITAIYEDRSGTMWVASIGGALHRFRNGEFTSYTPKGDLTNSSSIESIRQAEDGSILVAASDFFGYFLEGEFKPFINGNDIHIKIGPSNDNGVWVMENGKLRKFRNNRFLEQEWTLPPSERENVTVTALYEDREGYLWIGTHGNGLYRFKDGQFLKLSSHTGREGISQDIIWSIYGDREGNIWVGTIGGGLNRIREGVFQVLDTDDGLSENVVMSLCRAKNGDVWVGTDGGGLDCYHQGLFTHYSQKDGLPSESIWAVYEDRTGVIWAGTRNSGLLSLKDGKFKRYGRKEALMSDDVRAIYQDHKGRMWVGTYGGGLHLFNGELGVFTRFSTSDGLSNNDVRAIYEDSRTNLWIGTSGGLNLFKDSKFTAYTRKSGLPSDFIRTIYEDKDQTLWIGTGAGLSRFRDGKFVNFTLKNGLPDDDILQIFEDENRGNFWFGSNRGIFRIQKWQMRSFAEGYTTGYSYNSTTYDRADGLRSRECNGGTGCKTADGRLWFPTMRGIAVVDPNNLKVNSRRPPVLIEDVQADGVVQEGRDTVKLKPGIERVELHYTALSFVASRRIRFKYKLEGYDRDWIDAGFIRMAYYLNLRPGEYKFTVKAANSDGIWNDEGASIAIIVLPPFYRTWWFISLMLLFSATSITGGIRYLSVQKLKRKLILLEQQHALDKERARIAQDMHDDLGASITQIGLLSELVKRELKHPDKLAPLADKIVESTHDVVVTLDEIVWAVNPKNDTLDRLGAYIAQYAEAFFEVSDVRCRLDVPTDLPFLPLSTEVRHNVFLVVKEALNNIIKHARAREVWIHMKFQDQVLSITIEDDGKGFVASKSGSMGDGLQNMRKRVQEVNGDFELTSQPTRGTTLRITVKLS